MQPTKAIEILKDFIIQDPDPDFQDIADSIKLGIEALKFIKGLHDTGAMPSDARLPGEDPE